jgi:hypothetical protein
VKLRSHSIEGNKTSDARTLYRCLEKMCARISRTKERHSTKQNIIRIKLALTEQESLLQVFKITTVSCVALLTASTLSRGHQNCCRDGCARPFKFWRQFLQCCWLFDIHMSTISALKAHFPTIHHHFNMNLRCSKLNQPSAILTT